MFTTYERTLNHTHTLIAHHTTVGMCSLLSVVHHIITRVWRTLVVSHRMCVFRIMSALRRMVVDIGIVVTHAYHLHDDDARTCFYYNDKVACLHPSAKHLFTTVNIIHTRVWFVDVNDGGLDFSLGPL